MDDSVLEYSVSIILGRQYVNYAIARNICAKLISSHLAEAASEPLNPHPNCPNCF